MKEEIQSEGAGERETNCISRRRATGTRERNNNQLPMMFSEV